MKKILQQPIGSRKTSFMGDENGVAKPTNLPYSPKKLTWKGKACVTSNQLTAYREKEIGKLKAKRENIRKQLLSSDFKFLFSM